MQLNEILVVIPVFNEEASLPSVLQEIRANPRLNALIVDDASTDSSIEVAASHGALILPLPIKLGAWGAMQTGIRYAFKHGYQYVITMDGDGQHHTSEINPLIQAMDSDADTDVVIGACVTRGSRPRQLAWRFFRTITGIAIEDLTSGFRLYNHRAIEVLAGKDATLLDYQDIGVLLLLRGKGLKIRETSVTMTTRATGKSHVYSSWLVVLYYMLITTILSISKISRSNKTSS